MWSWIRSKMTAVETLETAIENLEAKYDEMVEVKQQFDEKLYYTGFLKGLSFSIAALKQALAQAKQDSQLESEKIEG